MINPVNAVKMNTVAPKKLEAKNNVTTPVELKKNGRKGGSYSSIDEKQNENLALELDYIGKQLKVLLDMQAGKNVKVEKFANKLPEDEAKTPAQKQKDDAIVQLGYIGDVLNKMVDVKAGKPVETVEPKRHGNHG